MNAFSPCRDTKFSLGGTWYFAWRDSPSFDLGFLKEYPIVLVEWLGLLRLQAFWTIGRGREDSHQTCDRVGLPLEPPADRLTI